MLAGVVADEELRALHAALATVHADPELADTVAHAAASASARGARQEAVALGEHALRLTPPESAARTERLLVLAGYLETAGEVQRLTTVLAPELEALPAGAPRARAWLLLSEGAGPKNLDDLERHHDRALAESQDDPGLRAYVLAKKAANTSATGVARIREAEAWASEALRAARRADPDVKRLALYALAWTRALNGRPIDDLCRRARGGVGCARIHCGIRRADRGPAAHLAGRGAQGANGADKTAGVGRRAGRADVIRVGASALVRARTAGRRLGRCVAPARRVGGVC